MKAVGRTVRVLDSVPAWAPAGYLGTDEDCVVVARVRGERLQIRRVADDGRRWWVGLSGVDFVQ